MIASAEEPLPAAVPDGEAKTTQKMLGTALTPTPVGAQNQLTVGRLVRQSEGCEQFRAVVQPCRGDDRQALGCVWKARFGHGQVGRRHPHAEPYRPFAPPAHLLVANMKTCQSASRQQLGPQRLSMTVEAPPEEVHHEADATTARTQLPSWHAIWLDVGFSMDGCRLFHLKSARNEVPIWNDPPNRRGIGTKIPN